MYNFLSCPSAEESSMSKKISLFNFFSNYTTKQGRMSEHHKGREGWKLQQSWLVIEHSGKANKPFLVTEALCHRAHVQCLHLTALPCTCAISLFSAQRIALQPINWAPKSHVQRNDLISQEKSEQMKGKRNYYCRTAALVRLAHFSSERITLRLDP